MRNVGHINEVQTVPYEGKPLFAGANSLFETPSVTFAAVPNLGLWLLASDFPSTPLDREIFPSGRPPRRLHCPSFLQLL